jgi:hypothetical protein
MAGSFGYEASHHDVSMQMAELSLLPAVRQQPDAIVVADGTSCRHQIHDGASARPSTSRGCWPAARWVRPDAALGRGIAQWPHEPSTTLTIRPALPSDEPVPGAQLWRGYCDFYNTRHQ